MKHDYSLAHLTAIALPPMELIDVAFKAGYQYVGLRLTRVTPQEPLYDLITDKAAMRATKAKLAETGVGVWDVELARMGPDEDAPSYFALLDAAAELGARHIVCQLPDPDRARAHARFAALCDYAKKLDLVVNLEFPWWTDTGNLDSACTVLNTVKRSNAGMLIDMLHFFRSGSSKEALRALPREWFHYAHVCDGPAHIAAGTDSTLHEARSERWFAGDGAFDVKSILACLPEGIPYALEIPGDALAAKIGLEEYARRALQAAQKYLD